MKLPRMKVMSDRLGVMGSGTHNSSHITHHQKGFTLVELIVVMAILSILLALVLVAINPKKRIDQANDTQRMSDVNNILNAISQYNADKKKLPAALDGNVWTSSNKLFLKTNSPQHAAASTSLCNDLVGTLGSAGYIAQMPVDKGGSSAGTWTDCNNFSTGTPGYRLWKNDNQSITVETTLSESAVEQYPTRLFSVSR